MQHISLNRLFVMWADEKELAETHLRLRTSTFDWPQLLKNRRVIVLAEAGSGKSDELKEQERLLSVRGDVAFYATLQDVGRKGLRAALPTTRKEQQFDAWRASNEHAYFFIDSVDEAKADDIDFTTVLNGIAKDITGAESRATIVLSGRVSDWEYKTDMTEFKNRLPILSVPVKPALPSADEILANVVAGNKMVEKQVPSKEEHLVVAMVALDRERIRTFAEARKVPDVEKFLTELDNANLWMLADRPLDLDWLVDYWIEHKRFEKFAKMLEYSIEHSLDEPSQKHGRRSELPRTTAFEKAERIGAGLLLGKKNEIAVPDRQRRYLPKPSDLKHDDLLKDISIPQRKELIDRPLFDPATFGRLRIHNDNEGKVRSFLAAKWLLRQINNNCDIRVILDILFAETYGVKVVRQSMQQTAAWLSLWNDHVAKEVISRQPGLLLIAGDPASLPLATRIEALNSSVTLMLRLDERFGKIDEDNLRRFSTPDIEPEIHRLWKLHKDNEEVRRLLLQMIWLGRLKGCTDIVSEALYTKYDEYVSEVLASCALVSIGTPEEKRKYATWLTKNHEDRHHQTVWEALTNFVPNAISISDFLKLFAALDKRGETSRYAIQTRIPDIIKKINNRADLEFIVKEGLKQIGEFPFSYQGEERPIYETYFPLISAAVEKLSKILPRNEFSEVAAEAALFIASADRYGSNRSEAFSLQEKFDVSNERRRGLFWKAYNLFNNSSFFKDKNGLQGPSQMQFMGWRGNLDLADFGWLLADAEAETQEPMRKFAINALMDIWSSSGRPSDLYDQVKTVSEKLGFTNYTDQWLAARKPDPATIAIERQMQAGRDKRAARDNEQIAAWKKLFGDVTANPKLLRRDAEIPKDETDGRTYNLWFFLQGMIDRGNHYAFSDVSPIEPLIGKDATQDDIYVGILVAVLHPRTGHVTWGFKEYDPNDKTDFPIATLNPYAVKTPLLKIEHGEIKPAFCLALSAKRYALFELDRKGTPIIIKASAHGLGHLIAPYQKNELPNSKNPSPKLLKEAGIELWQYDLWGQIILETLKGNLRLCRPIFNG